MSQKKLGKGQLAWIALISVVCVAGAYCFLTDFADAAHQGVDYVMEKAVDNKYVTQAKGIASGIGEAGNHFGISAGSNTASSKTVEVSDKRYEAKAIRVVAGDTLMLDISGKETRVRLIGVDVPGEIVPNEDRTVSEIVKEKIQAGDTLYVEYDEKQSDEYSRTLLYVYFEDGTMVQEWLLENGYANIKEDSANTRYADHFVELSSKAAESKVGLWNGFFDEE